MKQPTKHDPTQGAPERPPRRWLRRLIKTSLVGLALLTLGTGVLVMQGCTAFGTAPSGARATKMASSAQWKDGEFNNPEPMINKVWGALGEFMSGNEHGSPTEPIPVQPVDPKLFDTPPESGLRVTWLGHSTLIIEIEGRRFLTDPVWGERASPWTWMGPKQWYPPPIALADLPKFDAVIISHDHYDHLDHPTIVQIKDWDTTFVTPLGVGAHLTGWGVPEERIVELDWWDRHQFGSLDVVATPARHASGRHVFDNNRTLWAGYAFMGMRSRAFYSGDTGLFPGMAEIGRRLGPFDVTMIELGAYGKSWPDWHLGPEQAARANQMLRGKVMLPVHWGRFNLALHGWTEPIERLLVATRTAEFDVVAPRPGQSFEPASPPPVKPWWPDLPWRTADEYPIEASRVPASLAR